MFKVILTNIIEKTVLNVDTGKLPPAKAEEYSKRVAKTAEDGGDMYDVVSARPEGGGGTQLHSTGGYGELLIESESVEFLDERYSFIFYNGEYKDENVIAEIRNDYIVGIIQL